MVRRTSIRLILIPVLLALPMLAFMERAGAWCNTPRPAIPGRAGVASATPGGRSGETTPGARRTWPGTGGTFGLAGSWRIWWDFNREHLLGLQGVTGLSHLGGAAAIGPLIEILGNSARKRDTRISAATVLGLIIARRERDLLFELDAYTNPYGLTEASRELARVF